MAHLGNTAKVKWLFFCIKPLYYLYLQTMKKIFSLLTLLTALSGAFCQYNLDYGISVGAANYLGEMGGKEEARKDFIWDMKLNQTRWALGAFGRYKINPLLAVKGSFTYGRIQGADNLSTNPGRQGRNLSFRNDILELAAVAEVYLFNFADVGHRGRYRMDFKSYAFAGLAGFRHNPKTEYNGSWVALQPLQTEGVSYKNIGLSIPVGMGFYFTYRRQHRFGWDIGWRLTFTDYLDDVSTSYADPSTLNDPLAIELADRSDELTPDLLPQGGDVYYQPGQKRGDPTHNDTYFFMNFSYSYVMYRSSFYTQHYSWLSGRRSKIRKQRSRF